KLHKASIGSPTGLRSHYIQQIKEHKPAGMSDSEIEGIWNAWVEILSWAGDNIKESSFRKAVKLTLTSAVEVIEFRMMDKEAKEVERSFREGRNVVAVEDKEEKWY